MRRWVLSLIILTASATSGWAQLSAQVRLEKEMFLLYEAVPVAVSVRNYSGRAVQLQPVDGRPWLNLIVTDAGGSVIPSVGKLDETTSTVIPAGQTLTRRIDLLPLFELRQRGNYRVQVTVTGAGTEIASAPVKFSIMNGRELWSQVVGLPGEEGKPDEYRTYSLVAQSGSHEDLLYVLVRDEPHELVYGLVGLGGYLLSSEPQRQLDKRGHLHVLFQNGPRSFGYVEIDPFAKSVGRFAYSDFLSRPSLVETDGVVRVQGGEQTYPRLAPLTAAEEPPPPPKPKPKKKWWWPFGGRSDKPASP